MPTHTHMPFLHPDGMLYAAAPEAKDATPALWKIHIEPMGGFTARLHTGLPADMIECSPALAWFPGGFALTFIGQRDGDYRFYRMEGSDLTSLSPAQPVEILGRPGAHAGTVSSAFEAVDRPGVAGIEASAFGQPAVVIPYDRLGFEEVARIAFEFAKPWRMLVSGRMGDQWHTVVQDFKTGEVARIRLADGRGVYKASIDGDRLAHAKVAECRVGFRPVSADGLPLIGPAPDAERILLATGHGANGLSWGPYTGSLIADLVTGRPPGIDLAPFSPGRFSGVTAVAGGADHGGGAGQGGPAYAHDRARGVPA